ncbi:MAG TPA: zinc-ribbon domain-containing protein [Blastocatellia bacterium]|nr:zinc-ribbon domain-containing protein [Blastocatellia bacterium]
MQQLNAPSVRWEWISEAWNLFTKQWSTWVLMILVMSLVMGLIYLPFYAIAFFSMMPSVSEDGSVSSGAGFLPIVIFPVMYLAIVCVASWLSAGLYSAAFKQIRGEQIAVGDLFSGGRYFSRIIGALVLVGIAYSIGLMLCLIPGLIVYGLAFLTVPMIVEGGKGTIDAIKASIEVTKKDWVMFTLFAIALGFIAGAGAIACGVGILATAPLAFLGHALAYRDLVGMPGAQSQGQFMPPPPPDYRDYAPSQTPVAQPQPPAWTPPQDYGSTPTPESATKTCPHCGATLARAVNFCNQCGRPLRGA